VSGEKNTLGDPMMLSLFRAEVETHTQTMNSGLLNIEKGITNASEAESLMRAAHSIKGAARIVNIDMAVTLAHAMENLFVSIQTGTLSPSSNLIDKLLAGADVLRKIGELASDNTIDELMALSPDVEKAVAAFDEPETDTAKPGKEEPKATEAAPAEDTSETTDHTHPSKTEDVRVSIEHIDRLMNLAGEVMVRGNRLDHFASSFKSIETQMSHMNNSINHVLRAMKDSGDKNQELMADICNKHNDTQENLVKQMKAFESFTFDFVTVSSGIHDEAIASRMRPFSDGVVGFPRMVRDIAKSLKKEVSFEILGNDTKVDRNILRELKAPITHLLRNALDHGLENPDERKKAGKEKAGLVTLEASHYAGQLLVVVKDDGCGIDIDNIRKRVVKRELTTKEIAAKLSDDELLQFMFLPGFSTADEVTELSGRGFGLNVVSEMLQAVNGTIKISSKPETGTEMRMFLPLTLSVVRSLVFELNNEFYAFPLSKIGSSIEITGDMLTARDGQTYIHHNDSELPVIDGHDALQIPKGGREDGRKTAIQIGSGDNAIALTVDHCIGEQNLVIKSLDPRLCPAPVISSASIMEDGNTVLSLDIDNLLHMVNTSSGKHKGVREESLRIEGAKPRILVVEDSMTVREMERKLFEENGYSVDTAIDGMDGWNTLTHGLYDLIVSDVDMPRMNGLEFVSKLRADSRFKNIPVIIVSYKDSEKDKKRGMDAGANYYMTKAAFRDNSVIEIVNELLKDVANANSNS
jgi:two-component system sensor histidine kinase and response regulator WspE